jgi:prepilin peptidase CpaA
MIFGCALHIVSVGWREGIVCSLGGLLFGVALLIVPFALGGMGGGDVKLLAALGSLFGPDAVLHMFIYAALTGGIVALYMMIRRGGCLRTKGLWHDLVAFLLTGKRLAPISTSTGIPYSIPIAIGFLIYVLQTQMMP